MKFFSSVSSDGAVNFSRAHPERYVLNLDKANPQDLLDAIGEVERLVDTIKGL